MSKLTDRQLRLRLKRALRAAEAKKAQEIVILDVRKLTSLADYFLICHGANPRQNQAIADAIQAELAGAGLSAPHQEGYRRAEWIVLDYVQIVAHVFNSKTRNFYGLERLWRGAPQVALTAERKPVK